VVGCLDGRVKKRVPARRTYSIYRRLEQRLVVRQVLVRHNPGAVLEFDHGPPVLGLHLVDQRLQRVFDLGNDVIGHASRRVHQEDQIHRVGACDGPAATVDLERDGGFFIVPGAFDPDLVGSYGFFQPNVVVDSGLNLYAVHEEGNGR